MNIQVHMPFILLLCYNIPRNDLLAQLGEHLGHNQKVGGSNPPQITIENPLK